MKDNLFLFMILESSKMAYATLNESQICVFCSPEVHCLVLQYDPSSPDILLSLFVPVNESICSRILSQHLSVAFFGIDNNNSLYLSLEQHPRKVVFIGMLSSSTTSRSMYYCVLTVMLLAFCMCTFNMYISICTMIAPKIKVISCSLYS